MAGIYGESAASGDPHSDYSLFDLATKTWTPALTAQSLLWLAGGQILFLRPIDLQPLSPGNRHSVWIAQLAAFDLDTHQDTALTSGLVMNGDLALCFSASP